MDCFTYSVHSVIGKLIFGIARPPTGAEHYQGESCFGSGIQLKMRAVNVNDNELPVSNTVAQYIY